MIILTILALPIKLSVPQFVMIACMIASVTGGLCLAIYNINLRRKMKTIAFSLEIVKHTTGRLQYYATPPAQMPLNSEAILNEVTPQLMKQNPTLVMNLAKASLTELSKEPALYLIVKHMLEEKEPAAEQATEPN